MIGIPNVSHLRSWLILHQFLLQNVIQFLWAGKAKTKTSYIACREGDTFGRNESKEAVGNHGWLSCYLVRIVLSFCVDVVLTVEGCAEKRLLVKSRMGQTLCWCHDAIGTMTMLPCHQSMIGKAR